MMKPDFSFQTDGCSGGMSALWRRIFKAPPPWEGCCVEHDRAYWQGGTREQRAHADKTLMTCVAKRGHPVWALLMWFAVRAGGHPLLPFAWRWGFGWKRRGYRDAVSGSESNDSRAANRSAIRPS